MNTNRFWCIIGAVVFLLIMEYSFCEWIAPIYSYYMNLTRVFNIEKFIIALLCLIIIVILMEFDQNKLSNIVLSIQLLVMYIPMLTLYACSNRNTVFTLSITCAFFIQIVIVRIAHKSIPGRLIAIIPNSNSLMIIICISLLFLALLYSLFNYGIPKFNAFDFSQVYIIRQNVSYSFPFTYIIPWTFKIICLFILVWGLHYKKYLLSGAGLLSQLLFYLIYANKSTLFSILLVMICCFLVSRTNIIKSIIGGLNLLVIFSGLAYKVIGLITPLSYFVRRTLLVPATIKYAYYDYFSNHSFLYFAENSIGHLLGIQSPYTKTAPYLIGEFLRVPDSHCNTGYWGDAYANFGIFGIYLFSIILVFIILLVEQITEDLPKSIVYPLLIVVFYYLNDSALLTWLLGGGGGLLILLLWLYRNSLFQNSTDKRISEYASEV